MRKNKGLVVSFLFFFFAGLVMNAYGVNTARQENEHGYAVMKIMS